VDNKQTDFRPLVQSDQKSGAIHAGITREQVNALIGPTQYVSPDHRTEVYFIDTQAGFIIGVGCFGPPAQDSYALIVRFDDDGRVTSVEQDATGPPRGLFEVSTWPVRRVHAMYLKWKVKEIPVPKGDLPEFLQGM
jgi:outer membrane protein assembly factor BamE (lipoprotein component of BamABCDE complex)